MSSSGLKAFHLFALSHHLFAIVYVNTCVDFSKTDDHRVLQIHEFNLRYLTSWNFVSNKKCDIFIITY